MKVIVHGPAAGYGPKGTIDSWVPNELVEIDDGDETAVAWARLRLETGMCELVEDVAKKPAHPPAGRKDS